MKFVQKFNNLKRICDKEISFTNNIYLISNNSLNLIKGHPYHLRHFSKNIFIYFKNLIINILKLFLNLFKNQKLLNLKKKGNYNLLLISNLLNYKSLHKEDYVFGSLEKELKKKKISYHKIIVNHTLISTNNITKKLNKKNISVIDFESQSIFNNIKTTVILMSFFFLYFVKGIVKLNLLNLIFALDFLNLSTKKNLNILNNFTEDTKNFNYKNLLMPYEGYSWERLILMRAITKKPSKRIGYHFSAISKHQHSIFRKLQRKFQPDKIYTTGLYPKKKFKNKIDIPVKILGTNRHFSKIKRNFQGRKKFDFCVLPEGILSECKKLFLFSLKCAYSYPSMKFIWRLHPSMNFNFVLNKLSLIKSQLPKNIYLSKNNFFKDMNNSKFCIYRGSTSVITAIQNGVYPLYFNNNEEISIDPIFDFECWKTEINNSQEFDQFIKNSSKLVFKNVKNKTEARKFGEIYFQKMDYKNLINEF